MVPTRAEKKLGGIRFLFSIGEEQGVSLSQGKINDQEYIKDKNNFI